MTENINNMAVSVYFARLNSFGSEIFEVGSQLGSLKFLLAPKFLKLVASWLQEKKLKIKPWDMERNMSNGTLSTGFQVFHDVLKSPIHTKMNE